ncbi:unnamed protein product [Penicillium glandicola]
MSSKHELRQMEENVFENNETSEDSIADELPPTYNSLFSEDLLLPPPTTRDERRESMLIEEIRANDSSSNPFAESTDDVNTLDGTNEIPLDILLMLVGSREEIKSIIVVGQELHRNGHRVRVATHSIFQSLVHRAGLEFFSISSDPEHPIATRDSGLMPDSTGLDRQQVLKNKKVLLDTLKECWNACTQPTSHENKPFVADAIIATPLAHAHVHCAERLSIPLHIMSNSPWTPTRRFVHPLAQIETGSDIDYQLQNYLSYLLVGESVWHEVYNVVDHFRQAVLDLQPLSLSAGAGILREFRIPHSYLWSSELLPKPEDWDETIDISGYPTVESLSLYTPSKALENFLKSAIDPVFVALDITQLSNPTLFVQYLAEASQKHGVYLILPSGFREAIDVSSMPKIFLLDNEPNVFHEVKEWLISRISILLTSGDIPTVKQGVASGKPMVSLPLICDQPFWATTIYNAGIGPSPLREKALSSEILVEAFQYCLRPAVKQVAFRLGQRIEEENGTKNAVQSFYRHLQWEKVRCSDNTTEPVIYRMQLKPSINRNVETDGVVVTTRGGGSPVEPDYYPVHTALDKTPERVNNTFLVDAKGVSKSLIKAIIKPTVSHIADAHRKREAQNDVPVPTGPKVEKIKTRTGTAMKVARNVGFGSAVACGKIAILPFKTVWYMSETASYGVRALQGKVQDQAIEHSSHVNNSQDFDEGKVLDLRNVTHIISNDVYLATVIDADSLRRDDAYTRAFTASGMKPAQESQNTTQSRGGEGSSLACRRSESSAPSMKRE